MKMNSLLLTIMLLVTTLVVESQAQAKQNFSKSKFAGIFFNGNKKAKAPSKALNKATNPNLPVSTTFLTWNSTRWDSMSKSLFVYNSNDLAEVTTRQSYQGSSFVTSERDLHTYDTAGREIENINQEYISGNWVNSSRDTFAFSPEGIEILSLNQNWVNNAWLTNFGYRVQLTRGTDGEITEMVEQMLDSNGNWENTNKAELSYNASGNIDGLTSYQFDSTGNWKPLARFINATFMNNDLERPLSWTLQVPAPIISWVDFQRFTSYYNTTTKLMDSSLTESYNIVTQSWSNSSKDLFTYDSKGNQVLTTTHTWETDKWEMESGQKDSIIYNAEGNISTQITQYWNSFNPVWENSDMKIHAYPAATSVAENTTFSAHKIYPNPAREMVKVEVLGVKTDRVKISITDIAGRQVYINNINTQAGILNTTINTADLKSGIYIIQIQAGNQFVNQKLVKE